MPRIPAAERRSDFVKAAVKVIATHGIDGATTRRIAEQAQAPLATLHYCYHTKEDLFADVYAFVARRFREVVRENDPHADPATTARRLLRGLMECYLESDDFAATALELISWARRQHEDLGIRVYDEAFEAARTVLQSTASSRPLEAETIDEIAYVLATLADGFALNWLTYGDRSAAVKQMEVTAAVLDSWLAVRLASVPAALG
ncbi:TetR/AcrR family transcriptional regulator [Streptomyces sp. NK15101]|uniref:TetR/AcrR family transcriptional regulator n=1 Tax=Streptomyces sp. NK15101 TaxID=2873261 RepID=UPI001CED040A|nr:TetR/AcrR family transcriptional regulator [Streptomyces sp. NK15101]